MAVGAALFLAVFPIPARTADPPSPASVAAGPVEIEGAWARPGMEGGHSAAYFTLGNRGDRELELKGARADVATDTQIHRTLLEERTAPDGSVQQVMRMVLAGDIELDPGEQVVFKPGGLHVMLLGLKRALAEGDTIRLALFFDDLAPVELEVPVLPPTETGAGMGMGMEASGGM
ncbi:hypothetical protein LIP_1957 [Limnochorda pilosa]|uniref:Copper chaperone PCu(A)C n=1 Tax=Limnochorda pilosa TaxID=1555112 RepID=A0A0K2SL08_LIMPI|nr:hypothetical protein LIP_1957 [Limnochorda pilosa]